MKSRTETKSALKRRRTNYLPVLSLFLFLYCSAYSFGQSPSFSFQNTQLSEALLQVSKTLNFTIAFDSKAMSEFRVSGTFTGQNPQDILTQLIKNTGYKAEIKFGNYLIIPEFVTKQTAVPAYRRISGLIVDQGSGEHLPYANISLPFQKSYLTSSVNGTFVFRIPVAQSLRMNIQYLGYQSVDSTFSTTDSSAVLTLRMKPKSMELATVHIKTARLKMIDQNKEAGHSTVNPVGFVNLPNLGETDIFRTIQLLPGVGYAENSSGLNIRGGTADQNLVLFDGFTLYNLDHFFGTFSSINPNVVKDIQIYKGGFDSRYGERLSGIIDITGKTGNKYGAKINAGLNLVSGNLTAELPITEKLTLVIAGRRSYADIYSSFLVNNMLENQVDEISASVKNGTVVQLLPGYYFYDYNAKLTFSKSEQEKMSVSVFGGKDFLSSTGEGKNKQLYTKTSDQANWGNYGFSFSWIKQWHEKFFSNLQIGYSGYQNKYVNQTDVSTTMKNKRQSISLFETDEENKLNDFSASLRNQFSINLKNSINFGFQTKFNEFTYQKNAGTDAYYSDIASSSWLYTSYIQLNSQPLRNLSLKFGGRVSFYSPSNKFFYEPRISGNYRINDFISLKFATGRYYQFLNKVTPTQSYGYNRDFWVISDDKNHPVQSSDHFIAGTNFTYKHFSFDVEAYYKTINGIQLFLYIPPYQKNTNPAGFVPPGQLRKTQLPSEFINGQGRAVGLDLLLKYESSNFTSWIAYSRSKSIRNFKEINLNEDIPAPYDKAHEIKWTNLVTWRKWNFSGLWIYSTGPPYASKQTIDKTLTAKFTYDRLPDFRRIDIAANYNFRIQKVQVKVGMSVINLLNENNYNDIYSRDFNFDTTSFNETTYVKSLGITPNFFINFQY